MAEGASNLVLLSLLLSASLIAAIQRADLFPHGALSGDLTLAEGDDETSKVLTLPRPLYFYNTQFRELYVATNGIISAQDLPMEKQYVDDGFPTDFPVVAPFLADLDTTGGRGQIYFRLTETPSVLNRVSQEVHRGFPDARFTPTHAVVATWENVGAYEEQSRQSGPTNQLNTFQAVIAYDETDSYAVFLYPEDGLHFFGTRPKESYNVEIELPARVGFSRGEISYFVFSRQEGPHYGVTSDQQSVKNLYQVGNTGSPGVWLFHIGNSYSFDNIVPASVSGLLATARTGGYEIIKDTTTPEYGEFEEYTDSSWKEEEEEEEEEEEDYPVTTGDPEFVPVGGGDQTPESPLEPERQDPYERRDTVPYYPEPEEPADHDHNGDTTPPYPENEGRRYPSPPPPPIPVNEPEGGYGLPRQQQPPQSPLEVVDLYPPPQGHTPPHVVSVEEEEVDFDDGVIHYSTDNKETCARFQNQCSQNALCSDYPSGFCCHCQSGFYGNGRHCLPDGAPQRVSGKVRGTVTVGGTSVELGDIDLHAYVVVGDGRAYTAISEVPEPLGLALMPVAPIGELFGWLFALELPNSQAGFKITGADFVRHAEVIFYPGNERLTVVQTAGGLDEHNHLTVDTVVNGNLPFLPPGSSVTMEPFKETYQYYPSVTTSSSAREYSVESAERGSESFSFQLRQNLTHRDCRHDNGAGRPETLELSMERVFVMYVAEERILRYAVTNKIGPVGAGGAQQVNPCYSGSHDCDTTAQCLPSAGQDYQCQCATGYQGDGRNCYDVDECVEGVNPCGPRADCVNLPGSHRCQCHLGYQLGQDGRSCVDIDECDSSPCHEHATCSNGDGSFYCQCRHGFRGDGFQCSQRERPERPKSRCERHRDSVPGGVEPRGARPNLVPFVPECDADGQYRPLQCQASTGQCWCVDSSGQERTGTRTPPGTTPTDCNKPDEPERPKTHCEHHRDGVQTTSEEGYPLLGVYVPQCDGAGQYKTQQCHTSTGYCWCVDGRGQERADTRTSPGESPVDCDKPDEPERPKSRCEQHRDSVQTTSPEGHPIPGASAPQCDARGEYIPLQCHGSTAHCWCVDMWGQEREGTRTSPGTPPTDCDKPDEPERPKTHCEHHRDSVRTTSPEGYPILGAFVPECDENGQYKQQQCHGSTGHCWCVDNSGQERAGTRSPPGTPSTDCNKPDEPQRPKTHCEHHRDSVETTSPEGYPILGAFVPECDENGQYKQQQCHGSTGHCWCVDNTGREREGTRTSAGTTTTDCSRPDEPQRPKTHCENHRDGVETTSPEGYPILGAFVPECDENGQYKPQQCHGSTGHCWCVDNSGQERAGTRSPPGTPSTDCNKPDEPQRPKTHCEHHRDSVETTSPEGYPILGAFVPECDENGQYKQQQCHGSTGHCWCVDNRGQERGGTRTPPGTPTIDCDKPVEPERPKTHCQHHRDSVQTTSPEGYPIIGSFVPRCDANGQYIPLQCHGSTGHCWCVDNAGQERAGSRTPPGTSPKDCHKPDEPQRPQTHCEQHRDTAAPDGLPVAGAFIPHCDEDGQYRPQQCHGSTGQCWCVDSRGQERAGTRTRPGAPSRDCYKPDEPERPKTQCEHHRDNTQTTSPEGYPLPGVFVPECDAEGQYKTHQCDGSSGQCWCVDVRGQERPGTRTPAGTPKKDCNKPDHGASRPESVCERWRASLVEHYGGKPEPQHYLPQCDADGHFSPVQCYGDTSYCWCVDQDGREVEGTRSHSIIKPACISTVAPPTMRPLPRPDVTPPPSDIMLLYAQGQQIGALPLNGTRLDPTRAKTLLALHGSIVVGVAYDCQENKVYWSDLSGRTISRASITHGAEPEILINTDLTSPEGLAVDPTRRLMFWVDSAPDKIERAQLDGSGRRTLFHRDLVNPRAIIVVPSTGTLYWTDWNREAPKIECSTVDGDNRKVVVSEGIGLPNALTYDPVVRQICWADAGTKRLECVSPDGSGRRVVHSDLNYPFSMVYHRNHFYYSDWRRDGVIAVNKDSSKFTDEFLPDQRSHLYGITIATTSCLSGNH